MNYKQMDTSSISCNVHQESLTVINNIKLKINHGQTMGIKVKYAEELSNKVTSLIYCPQYDAQKLDCKCCRIIAFLNRKTAVLILKARSLSL
jgi:hypothetical protein